MGVSAKFLGFGYFPNFMNCYSKEKSRGIGPRRPVHRPLNRERLSAADSQMGVTDLNTRRGILPSNHGH
jgi:hypothetical protein